MSTLAVEPTLDLPAAPTDVPIIPVKTPAGRAPRAPVAADEDAEFAELRASMA